MKIGQKVKYKNRRVATVIVKDEYEDEPGYYVYLIEFKNGEKRWCNGDDLYHYNYVPKKEPKEDLPEREFLLTYRVITTKVYSVMAKTKTEARRKHHQGESKEIPNREKPMTRFVSCENGG